ncbi:LutB/LldF family L-lactate oxidation iron-sulfur protein [Rhodocytophaga aerolata]|uniref:LutB/LldF family L-lactate oxidation iron-sulfur protein n=1 Tax=Rhodocytophaga aerolata TaxID=455078 RepID=A0ABT8R7L9_9BACT|nr:LutB/LldF family L-lactate oxidation iron-sulfur protein [Rhodocytophaga aerolata]MDO1448097.1 LutB/LldF family L-lactate oxidation iron-sulfur protein [Rhodocytophaga aerolata]
MKTAEIFQTAAENKAFDLKHRTTINFNIGKYNAAVKLGLGQYTDHELARSRASYIKTQSVENLDKYLLQFEENFTKRGGKVIWAETKEEAIKEILAIFEKKKARMVVKSKSMTTEEIHLNEHLEQNGIEAVETDLGEYIVQLAGQRPYHIVTPAMHLSKKDISEIFFTKLKTARTDDAQELTMIARRLLREKYTEAGIGITGGNFIVADVGGIALTENEGNARLTVSFPKTHIAIIGIEKVIPSIHDLDLFWPLLATSGTGQQVTNYSSVVTGPRQKDETDGPEEMYVILLDNGRTNLLNEPDKRQALNCIRCGACLNACPVYKNIGGHTYDTTYSGPIGSVITPHLAGMKEYKHLSYASSLCGNCSAVCPVRIDIHNLLLLNRRQSVEEGLHDKSEAVGFKMWAKAMKSRRLMNLAGAGFKNLALKVLFKDTWGRRRVTPVLPPRSFNQLWKEKRNK